MSTTIWSPTAESTLSLPSIMVTKSDLAGKTIGIIDNRKPNFDNLVRKFCDRLKEHYGLSDIRYHAKQGPTVGASPEVFEDLSRCAVVFTGSGD